MNPTERSSPSGRPILIFPGGMPRSLEYLQRCLRDDQPVIGASSLSYDVSREKYPSWHYLPFVTQPGFNDALKEVIRHFDIAGVFSPNPVIWSYLNQFLKDIAPGVSLVNASPVDVELSGYRKAREHARALLERPLPVASDDSRKPALPEIELAALFRHADLIPGMCDHEKLCALCEIARLSPAGDVVEIGTWWGKSAFILARLAHCHGIGKLLCVDPWTNEHLVQQGGTGLVDSGSAAVDAEEALAVFKMNLLPYNVDHINYLRMPSTEGAAHYLRDPSATTAEFGVTRYRGRIAILHIDGNHAYESVKADIASWTPLVVDRGWIVVDDYTWPYGDGPQRAADELLADHPDDVAVAFAMGGALFIQLARSLRTRAT